MLETQICVTRPQCVKEMPGSVVNETPCRFCALLCHEMHHLWLFLSRHKLLIPFIYKPNLTFESFMSDVPLHTYFFFVAYGCVCEGWDEVEMTTEDVHLHDRTSQDVILKSRQQTDWRSDILYGSVLRIVGKHLLKCTRKQFSWLKYTGKQFSWLKYTGKQFSWLKYTGKQFSWLKYTGKQFSWLKYIRESSLVG